MSNTFGTGNGEGFDIDSFREFHADAMDKGIGMSKRLMDIIDPLDAMARSYHNAVILNWILAILLVAALAYIGYRLYLDHQKKDSFEKGLP